MDVNIGELLKLIPEDVKWLAVLVFVLVALQRKYWVIGWMYEEKCVEVEYWRIKADRATETGKVLGHAASDLAGLAKEAVTKR